MSIGKQLPSSCLPDEELNLQASSNIKSNFSETSYNYQSLQCGQISHCISSSFILQFHIHSRTELLTTGCALGTMNKNLWLPIFVLGVVSTAHLTNCSFTLLLLLLFLHLDRICLIFITVLITRFLVMLILIVFRICITSCWTRLFCVLGLFTWCATI